MSKSHGKKTRWNIIIMIIVAGALSYAGFRYLYPPQSANIFAITPDDLQYGDTTVTGELRKDTPIDEEGYFLLILPDSRVIVLDVTGLDHILGSSVSVSGYLSPTVDRSLPMYMTVQSLTVLE